MAFFMASLFLLVDDQGSEDHRLKTPVLHHEVQTATENLLLSVSKIQKNISLLTDGKKYYSQ